MTHSLGNRFRYLQSFGNELASQANRVRDLIGSRHWASDGRHKERILAAVLRKYLPSALLLSSGFVINPTDPSQCSKEQDLLVVDTWQHAPVMNEDHLVIAFPSAVLAAVSVKTSLGPAEIEDALVGLATARSVCNQQGGCHPWCGVFFYDTPTRFDAQACVAKIIELLPEVGKTIAPSLPTGQALPFGPDLIATVDNFAVRLDYSLDKPTGQTVCTARAFSCGGMAPTLLLAALLEHIADARGSAYPELNSFVEGQSFNPLCSPKSVVCPR